MEVPEIIIEYRNMMRYKGPLTPVAFSGFLQFSHPDEQ